MMILAYIIGAVAVAAWFVVLISGIRMMGMLKDGVSWGTMLFRGIQWFNPDQFKPEAAGARRMLVGGFVTFFVCIVAAMMLFMLSLPRP